MCWDHLPACVCMTITLKLSSQRGPQASDKGEDENRGPASLADVICSDLLSGQGGTRAQELLAGC